MKFIKAFEDVNMSDLALVGGKNASLGEMISELSARGIRVPSGFIITADAYWHHLKTHNLVEPITALLKPLNKNNLVQLASVGEQIRTLISSQPIPANLADEIRAAYAENESRYGKNWRAAVRSSATAEDLPNASFAGQQETYLNIVGAEEVIKFIPLSFASLFTNRAISYRIDHNFDHMHVALSVGVQKMIRSDLAASGVIFTLDTETGFDQVVYITSSYGLGENIVQGTVNPDEFYVHKPTRKLGFKPILKKRMGSKQSKLIFDDTKKDNLQLPVINMPVSDADQQRYSISNAEILELADFAMIIEDHYAEKKGSTCPMDIEWAKDGESNQLFIVQARPETVYSKNHQTLAATIYAFTTQPPVSATLATGKSVGKKIASGTARCIASASQINLVQEGDIVITDMTDPDWEPIMHKAAAIITNRGGRTCHAAIVSRELGIAAIVGTGNGTDVIKNGEQVTVDCSTGEVGTVYQGTFAFEKRTINLDQNKKITTPLMINVGNPDEAFTTAYLPHAGIGLARLEFIINTSIKIHPMALVHPEKVSPEAQKQIDELTISYSDKKSFFIDTLAQEAGTIAAAAYPRPVIIRCSDFKSNEYRALIGGNVFEPIEENPMLGFRGASRYYHPAYAEAFIMECKALQKMRGEMGFTNIKIMVPFVRTVAEAEQVIALMAEHGLARGVDGLELYMMCEIPSNVLLIDAFSQHFDGFSIGSNDLTQMTLGIDRDSNLVAPIFDERNPAVMLFLEQAIKGAQRNHKKIGICGQAPSDYPELAQQLITWGIDSISLNPDSLINTMLLL